MKHLNSFLAQGQRDLNQTFSKNSNAQGVTGAEGGGRMLKLQFNQYITDKSFPASRDSLSFSREEVQRGKDKTWARVHGLLLWSRSIVLPMQKVSQTVVKASLRPN